MDEAEESSLMPESKITRDCIWDTLTNWAKATPHWQHIRDSTIDTKDVQTHISSDVRFIDDAKIPAITAPREEEAPKAEELSAEKPLTVEMLSGQAVQIKVPAPYTVAQVKQRLETCLGIPAFLQALISGAEELPDEAVVTGDSVAFLRREPPMIEAEDFLRSIVATSWERRSIFYRWHAFDTYMQFPDSEPELLEWVLSHRKMKNVPLSAASMLEALDVWLEDNGKAGAHPEAFKEDVEKVAAFMCHCCYSPSLLVVYNGPFAHEYDLGYVLFVVGRLRSEPQTFVVQSFLLKCRI
ncbi:unnamed protein product [Symbiodinium necroappetens]|uniref:Ubiquitin-like domain-containing protein n=1 Tax=Symbiodinium necroappetens TaxID=1628268 RepID=A0A813CJT7_9DINO|nr:unnamed protein product [Symbiodinium necroappetens]